MNKSRHKLYPYALLPYPYALGALFVTNQSKKTRTKFAGHDEEASCHINASSPDGI